MMSLGNVICWWFMTILVGGEAAFVCVGRVVGVYTVSHDARLPRSSALCFSYICVYPFSL